MLEHTEPQPLCADRCRALLAGISRGHLAVSQAALPVVVPVVYKLVGRDLLVRAGLGLVGRVTLQPEVVAFETSNEAGDGSWAWEVLVQGRAEPLVSSGPAGPCPAQFPLVAPELTIVLRMHMERLTGWQYGPVDEEKEEAAGA